MKKMQARKIATIWIAGIIEASADSLVDDDTIKGEKIPLNELDQIYRETRQLAKKLRGKEPILLSAMDIYNHVLQLNH